LENENSHRPVPDFAKFHKNAGILQKQANFMAQLNTLQIETTENYGFSQLYIQCSSSV